MFSPRAENFDMPGRPPAAPRSRWAKLPVRATWADQSPATRARSPSHLRAARPRARRSALRRSNRSLVSVWAVDPPPAGAAAVVGGAVVRGAREVVVAARVVVVGAAVVVVRPGRRFVPAAVAPATLAGRAASGARAAAAAGRWLSAPPGLALAGSRAQASSNGKTIRNAILRLPRHGEVARAWRGRTLEPRGAG